MIESKQITYPLFRKGDQISVLFFQEEIRGTFIEWKSKSDRPFGYWLFLHQNPTNFIRNLKKRLESNQISSEEYSMYIRDYTNGIIRGLNDQYITSINGKQFTCIPQ